jgi:hypothetical protein
MKISGAKIYDDLLKTKNGSGQSIKMGALIGYRSKFNFYFDNPLIPNLGIK